MSEFNTDRPQSQTNPDIEDTARALQNLIDVVAQLRSPTGGCPWDLAQTPQTLIPYIIEEAYEVVDALSEGDVAAIAEELGDLLLQVVLQAQIAHEYQQFSLATVAQNITEKLIRRHPHVFGTVKVENVDQVEQNWEKIKAEEHAEPTEAQFISPKLSRYARQLPPLLAATKISKKAVSAGFEWDNVEGVWQKFHEELGEFVEALQHTNKAHQQAELGDILFTLVNLARWYDLDAESALRDTNHRFVSRFSQVEKISDRPLSDYSVDELDAFWQQAKALLSQQKSASNPTGV
ncbi:MAG: nucleoside triphosphate pyrophosphohydrolase [Microcoleaceae cyanobacterium]